LDPNTTDDKTGTDTTQPVPPVDDKPVEPTITPPGKTEDVTIPAPEPKTTPPTGTDEPVTSITPTTPPPATGDKTSGGDTSGDTGTPQPTI